MQAIHGFSQWSQADHVAHSDHSVQGSGGESGQVGGGEGLAAHCDQCSAEPGVMEGRSDQDVPHESLAVPGGAIFPSAWCVW